MASLVTMAVDVNLIESARYAACAIASAHGLSVSDAKLIGGYANIMIELHPLPIVARVAASSLAARADGMWLAREVRVAEFLSESGALVTRPSPLLPLGPHRHGGLAMTFWELVDVISAKVTPRAVGKRLHMLHKALASYSGELPLMGPIAEAWQLLEMPKHLNKIDPDQRHLVAQGIEYARDQLSRREFDMRPLHGDAHHGNLLKTSKGLAWTDFEDALKGPLEWDLASLTASSYVFGTGRAAKAALQGYGAPFDQELVDLLVVARTLQAVAWALVLLQNPRDNSRFISRLEWLAERVARQ